MHGGEPCDAEALALSLAAFLVGAANLSYFSCSDGWRVGDGWSRAQRPAEYDYPLGPPLGEAVRSALTGGGVKYVRRFESGTSVTLLLEAGAVDTGAACIRWGNGQQTGTCNGTDHTRLKSDDRSMSPPSACFFLQTLRSMLTANAEGSCADLKVPKGALSDAALGCVVAPRRAPSACSKRTLRARARQSERSSDSRG